MNDKNANEIILKRINDLFNKFATINLDENIDAIKRREESLLYLIEEEKKLKEKLIVSKNNEKELISRVQKYEGVIQKAISQREKNIRHLQNRVTVLEQSVTAYVVKRMKKGVRRPLTIPNEVIKISKAIGGGVKRKITKQKRKYRLVKLPFVMNNVPNISNKFILDKESDSKFKMNDLFLMGRYNSPSSLKELRVASILDEFSYETFKHEAKLITFKPDNWFEVMKTELPHMLLVESAWQGNSGSWQYKIASYNIDQGNEINELLLWCKDNNIPTIFWNKEDPIHFDKFINTASKFDYIYTSDENCIDLYREYTGKDNVFSLSFAAQPKLHNPIKVSGYKANSICFAGSYYSSRHSQRKKEQEKLLEAAQKYDLVIFDRNYGTKNISQELRYPEKFAKNIRGALPYLDLVNSYKQFKVFLNVNSVKNSNTMFSRRVYELLACGTSVISTDSKGIDERFGDVVTQVNIDDDHHEKIEYILENNKMRKTNEIRGQRKVFNEHTYAHRLFKIATNAGFTISQPYSFKLLLMVKVYDENSITKVLENFYRQNYAYKKLVIFNYTESEYSDDENVIYINVKQETQEKMDFYMGRIIKESNLLGTMNSKSYYGKDYLTDIVHSFIYTDADLVGKSACYILDKNNNLITKSPDKQYMYINNVLKNTFLINTLILSKYGLNYDDLLNENVNFEELSTYGLRMFSGNMYNYLYDGDNLTEFHKKIIDI